VRELGVAFEAERTNRQAQSQPAQVVFLRGTFRASHDGSNVVVSPLVFGSGVAVYEHIGVASFVPHVSVYARPREALYEARPQSGTPVDAARLKELASSPAARAGAA
jgi:hypothetical protein